MPAAKKRGQLPVGTTGYAKHKGQEYTLVVVKADNGIAFKVGRSVYSSPSAAARAITGLEANGWRFWHLE